MATPPDFTTGQVLTAAQMNQVGLWLVKTQTIGSAVSSVTVSDAFNADYENYKIIINGGSASSDQALALALGSTATDYRYSLIYHAYGTASADAQGIGNNAGTNFLYAGSVSSNGIHMSCEVFNPYLAKRTAVSSSWTFISAVQSGGIFNGFLANATSYTSFTIAPASGTITGGEIRVYGYRK